MAKWQCLRIVTDREALERLVGLLEIMGTTGLEERPHGPPARFRQPWDPPSPPPAPSDSLDLLAWFEANGEEGERLEKLEAEGHQVTEEVVEEEDWGSAWMQGFQPFDAGGGLVVAPPWSPTPGALIMEPGMAFGTGEHPTTRACLAAIIRHSRPGDTMLDVGTGSGILALAAARRGMRVEAVDVDPAAIAVARENASRNDLGINLHTTPVDRITGRRDLVVANIFAESLRRLSAALVELTGRRLVLAGILADRAHILDGVFHPLVPMARHRDGDWVCLELIRP